MGVVYLALDTELNRKVAFKMIRAGAEGPLDATARTLPADAEARFLQEAWVTGGLEHPGIVPVYELGRTPSGVPYYTMRVVRGERTLEDAIKGAGAAEERLALLEPFLKVCDAVRYAHSRNVIHRDLKPANVALGPFGEVVLLDWGLAKVHGRPDLTATRWQSRLEELRAETDFQTLTSSLGTPGYMAPEAALGRIADVGEHSDVYSLGAILYRILTGRLPFEFETYLEFVQKVIDGVTEVPGGPATLERICLKALETSIEDRYGGVEELASAIRAWQAESAVEREILALTDRAGAVLNTAATMEGDALLRQLDRAVSMTTRIHELRPGHEEAGALLERARELRTRAITEGERAVRKRLLKRVGILGLVTATAATVVVAFLLNARRQDAEDARAAAETERARAEQLANFMLFDLRDGLVPIGRLDLLGKVARKSLEYYETLPTENVSDTTWQAREIALKQVGGVLSATGDLKGAEVSFRAALEIAERLRSEASVTRALTELGYVELSRGDLKTARATLTRALEIARRLASPGDDPDRKHLSICLNRLGDVERAAGNVEAALAHYLESVKVSKALAATDPNNAEWQRQVSVGLDRLGIVQRQSGDVKAALSTFSESLRIARVLADRDPSDYGLKRDVVVSLWKVGKAESDVVGMKTAAPRFREALGIARLLAERDPANTIWQGDLASSLEFVGNAQLTGKDVDGAAKSYREALEIMRRLVAHDASNAKWPRQLCALLGNVGDIKWRQRDLKAALARHREALDVATRLADRDKSNIAWKQQLATTYVRLGDIQAGMMKRTEALANFRSALRYARVAADHDSTNSHWQRELSVALYRVGTTLHRLGSAESEPILKEAVAVHARAVKLAPHLASEHAYWVKAYRGAELIAGKRTPESPSDHLDLAYALYRRKDLLKALAHFETALADEEIRADLNRDALYSAACAAALMTGEGAQSWHDKAVRWLAENQRMRRDLLAKLLAELTQENLAEQRRSSIEYAVKTLRDQIEWARTGDKELASLRQRPDFQKIFEGD